MPRTAAALALAALAYPPEAQPGPASIRFRNVAESAGVRFTLRNHASPEKHYIETMPGGIALFDYNGDGRIDIYFTNGAAIPSLRKESPADHNRLFRNDGNLRFTDVTPEAGGGIGRVC